MSGRDSPLRILRNEVTLRSVVQNLPVGRNERRLMMTRRGDNHPVCRIRMKAARQDDSVERNTRQQICDFYALQTDYTIDPSPYIQSQRQAIFRDKHRDLP